MQRSLSTFRGYSLLVLVLFLSTVASVHAQSTTQDLQSEKDRAQLEADIAKAKQDKATADAATLKAQLGGLSTTNLPQGKTTVDNVVIEANYLAYMAANSAAKVIASRIPCGSNVFFFSATDLNGIQALQALSAQIPLIANGNAALIPPLELRQVSASILVAPSGDLAKLYTFPPAGGLGTNFTPGAIFAGIDAGLSVLSLFKTDTEFHGATVEKDDLALQALVAQHRQERCSSDKVIQPIYSYPRIETDPAKNPLIKGLMSFSSNLSQINLMTQNLTDRVQTPLGKAVDGLRKLISDHRDTLLLIKSLNDKLNSSTVPANKKKIQDDIDTAKKHLADLNESTRTQYDPGMNLPAPGMATYSDDDLVRMLEPYVSDQLRVDGRIQALKSLQSKMTDFIAALTKPDSNGITPLVALLRAQALTIAMGPGANLLQTGFVTAGGNNIIKRNFFNSSLRFSGGVVAKYLYIDTNGFLKTSGVVSCYGGQLKESEISGSFANNNNQAIACTETAGIRP